MSSPSASAHPTPSAKASSLKPTPTPTPTPIATVSGKVTCPKNDGSVFVDRSTGKKFAIECGVVHDAGVWYDDFDGVSFKECIQECASRKKCVNVSYKGDTCYLKKSLGRTTSNTKVWSARLLA